MTRPTRRRPRTVWVVAPGTADKPQVSGIYHANDDCPVLVAWGRELATFTQLWEADLTTGEVETVWELRSAEDFGREEAGWHCFFDKWTITDIASWRPCQRCGQLRDQRSNEVTTCPKCWLTQCDCDL